MDRFEEAEEQTEAKHARLLILSVKFIRRRLAVREIVIMIFSRFLKSQLPFIRRKKYSLHFSKVNNPIKIYA